MGLDTMGLDTMGLDTMGLDLAIDVLLRIPARPDEDLDVFWTDDFWAEDEVAENEAFDAMMMMIQTDHKWPLRMDH